MFELMQCSAVMRRQPSTTAPLFCGKVTEDKNLKSTNKQRSNAVTFGRVRDCWLSPASLAWSKEEKKKTCTGFLELEKARKNIWSWPSESGSELWFVRVPVIMTGLHELKATTLISARHGYIELKLLLDKVLKWAAFGITLMRTLSLNLIITRARHRFNIVLV